MEAVNELGLTKQLEQINVCQMFLQVMTLVEVVDHTGTTLLPHALKQWDAARAYSSQYIQIAMDKHPPSLTSQLAMWNQPYVTSSWVHPMAPN